MSNEINQSLPVGGAPDVPPGERFALSYEKIRDSYGELNKIWKTYQKKILDGYTSFNNKLSDFETMNPTNPESVLTEYENGLVADLETAKTTFQNDQNPFYNLIKTHSGQIAALQRVLCSQLTGKREKDKDILDLLWTIHEGVNEINKYVAMMDYTNNSQRIWEKLLIGVEAAIEEKYHLIKQSIDPKALKTAQKKLYSFTDEQLKALIEDVERKIKEPPKILSPDTIKEINKKYDDQFKPVDEYYKYALARKGQWTKITRIFFKTTGNLHLHAAVIEQNSISMIPSTYNKDKILREEGQANLFDVKQYLLDDKGNPLGQEYLSYRGAQIATELNALRVVNIMTGPDKKSAVDNTNSVAKTSDKTKKIAFISLLTPGILPMPHFKLERKLLAEQKKNIEDCVRDLNGTKPIGEKLKEENVSISNIGINCMANGTFKILGQSLSLGWQRDIKFYMNPSIEKLNGFIEEFLQSFEDKKNLDEKIKKEKILNAILVVGKDLKERWDHNDFATGDRGYDFLAYWIVLHQLLGVKVYVNCKSGKDRTGEIESRASHLLSEAMMLMEENTLTEKVKADDLSGKVKRFREQWFTNNQGVRGNIYDPFFKTKKVSKLRFLFLGLHGIEGIKHLPTRSFPKMEKKLKELSDKSENLSPDEMKKVSLSWENEQRIAQNLRNSCSTSLPITGNNTAQWGYKYAHKNWLHGVLLSITNPTQRSVSGFDRDFVLMKALIDYQEMKQLKVTTEEEKKNWEDQKAQATKSFLRSIGADELHKEIQENIARKFEKLFGYDSLEKFQKQPQSPTLFFKKNKRSLKKLFKLIEKEKKFSFQPLGKVLSD